MTNQITHGIQASTLADVLERVLDKGVVVAGDVLIKLADVELLTIKIRLLICSVDKAKEIGINWWETDSYLTSKNYSLEEQNKKLLVRIEELEKNIKRKT